VVLAKGQLAPTSIAVDPSGVYWTNVGTSTAQPPFGDGAVVALVTGAASPTPLAPSQAAPDHLHASGGALYWSSSQSWKVSRMANGGGGITQLNAGEPNGQAPQDITIEPDAGIVAWSEDSANPARSTPLAGGSPVTALVQLDGGAPEMAGIALDDTYVYLSELDGTGAIQRFQRVCPKCPPVALASGTYVLPVVSDGQRLFYADSVGKVVGVVVKGSVTPATIPAVTGGLMTSLAVDADWIYWTEYGPTTGSAPSPRASSGVVARARKDLSHLQVLAQGQNHPHGVAVDATSVYWTNAGTRTGGCPGCCDPGCFDQADGQVMRITKPLDPP
jgi:hypothetical protein